MGIFAVHKPMGMTSHDVVDRVRRITGEKKVGHAGTLDPMAEGVLVVAVGRDSTKKISQEVQKEKEYEARVIFGATSDTDDAEGEIIESFNARACSLDEVVRCVEKFEGAIEQMPPVYSAIKVGGVPAHRRVRRGQQVELRPRSVYIKDIEILSYEYPELRLRVVCGPGVYIRSLARDIGSCLGVGGYLGGLVRTRVGEYTLDNAHPLSTLSTALE